MAVAEKYKTYRTQKKREHSHVRRMERHLKKHPKDYKSVEVLSKYRKLI